MAMSLGPLMIDLNGTALDAGERELLCHPLVGGVILFSRNFESPEQLERLLQEVHGLREPRLLIAVDHEGGRVQRFRNGFTPLPPARLLGDIYEQDRQRGLRFAGDCGWVMANELRAVGVDFSFAPVLDLDRGISRVIGDRAFHHDPEGVADLAHAYMVGMRRAGMAATGKHFPGHGGVEADSHEVVPVDDRPFEDIYADDVRPFERLVHYGLAGVMPAHVVYSQVDPLSAGFSAFWLKEVLRTRLGFQGVVFSDDLSMEGASVAGDYLGRAEAAIQAGCDMILVCNHREAVLQVLQGLKVDNDPVRTARMARMHARHPVTWDRLHRDAAWVRASKLVRSLAEDPSLDLAL